MKAYKDLPIPFAFDGSDVSFGDDELDVSWYGQPISWIFSSLRRTTYSHHQSCNHLAARTCRKSQVEPLVKHLTSCLVLSSDGYPVTSFGVFS